jgi:hypothetical protein
MIPLEHLHEGDWAGLNRVVDTLRNAVNPPVPQARVFNSAAIATTTAVAKTLTFDSERWDNGSLHSTSANTSRLTAPITGLYAIGANVEFASNVTGFRALQFDVTFAAGGTATIAFDTRNAANGVVTIIPLATQYQLAAGDYVEAVVTQTSGGALNVAATGNRSPEFWMHRVGGYVNQGV